MLFYIPTRGTGLSLFLCILANTWFFPLKFFFICTGIFFNLQILPLSLSFPKNMFIKKLRQVELQSFLVWILLIYVLMMNPCMQLDPEASSNFSLVL